MQEYVKLLLDAKTNAFSSLDEGMRTLKSRESFTYAEYERASGSVFFYHTTSNPLFLETLLHELGHHWNMAVASSQQRVALLQAALPLRLAQMRAREGITADMDAKVDASISINKAVLASYISEAGNDADRLDSGIHAAARVAWYNVKDLASSKYVETEILSLLDEKTQLLLAKRSRSEHLARLWEAPGVAQLAVTMTKGGIKLPTDMSALQLGEAPIAQAKTAEQHSATDALIAAAKSLGMYYSYDQYVDMLKTKRKSSWGFIAPDGGFIANTASHLDTATKLFRKAKLPNKEVDGMIDAGFVRVHGSSFTFTQTLTAPQVDTMLLVVYNQADRISASFAYLADTDAQRRDPTGYHGYKHVSRDYYDTIASFLESYKNPIAQIDMSAAELQQLLTLSNELIPNTDPRVAALVAGLAAELGFEIEYTDEEPTVDGDQVTGMYFERNGKRVIRLPKWVKVNTIGHEAGHGLVRALGRNHKHAQELITLGSGDLEAGLDILGDFFAGRLLAANPTLYQRVVEWIQGLWIAAKETLGLKLTQDQVLKVLTDYLVGDKKLQAAGQPSAKAQYQTQQISKKLNDAAFSSSQLFDVMELFKPFKTHTGKLVKQHVYGFITPDGKILQALGGHDDIAILVLEEAKVAELPDRRTGSTLVHYGFIRVDSGTLEIEQTPTDAQVATIDILLHHPDFAEGGVVAFYEDTPFQRETMHTPTGYLRYSARDAINNNRFLSFIKSYKNPFEHKTSAQQTTDAVYSDLTKKRDDEAVEYQRARRARTPQNSLGLFLSNEQAQKVFTIVQSVINLPRYSTPLSEINRDARANYTPAKMSRIIDKALAKKGLETDEIQALRSVTAMVLDYAGTIHAESEELARNGKLQESDEKLLQAHLIAAPFLAAQQAAASKAGTDLRIHGLDVAQVESVSVRKIALLNAILAKQQKTLLDLTKNEKLRALMVNPDDPLSVRALIESLSPPTLWDFISNYYYNNILGALSVPTTNIIGNTLRLAVQIVEDATAASTDALLGRLGLSELVLGRKERTRFLRDVFANLSGAWKLGRGFEAAKLEFLHPYRKAAEDLMGDELFKFIADIGHLSVDPAGNLAKRVESPTGKKLLHAYGWVENIPLRMAIAGDLLFRSYHYEAWMRKMAYDEASAAGERFGSESWRKFVNAAMTRLADNDGAKTEAANVAANRVFMGKAGVILRFVNQLRTWSAMVDSDSATLRNVGGALATAIKMIIPMVHTHAKIFEFGMQHVPGVGLLMDAGKRAAKNANQFIPDLDPADTIARQILGTLILAMLWWLMEEGEEITGMAPRDPNERESWYRQGKMPYSVNYNGTWVTYDMVDSFGAGAVMKLAANARDLWLRAPDFDTGQKIFEDAAFRIKDILTSSPFADTADRLMNVYGIADIFKKLPANMLPAAGFTRWASKIHEAATQGYVTVLQKDVPSSYYPPPYQTILHANTPTRLNVYGEDVHIPTSVLQEFLPLKWRKDNPGKLEPVFDEIGYYPAMPGRTLTIGRTPVKIPDDLYRQHVVFTGQMLKQQLERFDYDGRTTEMKLLLVKRIVSKVHEHAEKKVKAELVRQGFYREARELQLAQ